MKCLICYDIGENRIRNKVARYLESLAVRVEYSVFLCDLAPKKAGGSSWKAADDDSEVGKPETIDGANLRRL